MAEAGLAPLAVSIGEPAGIGPDLIVTLYKRRRELSLPPFLVYGDSGLLKSRAARLGLDIETVGADPQSASGAFNDALPVSETGAMPDTPGHISPKAGGLVVDAINRAAEDCLAGRCRAVVTAPIQKSALYATGFDFPGHTEYLAHLCAYDGIAPTPVMMLAFEAYRAVPLTIHVPLRQVPDLVTTDLIVETCRIVVKDLHEKFRIIAPRVAVAGLNPHAGEYGALGTEDRDTITPAIARLQLEGHNVAGPFPADTLFHPPHWKSYDAVVAMYHDQALIPVKTIGFDKGVNITLGLPIVRTSPDHGTALGLAGTGKASVESMLAALRMADQMSYGK